MVNMRAVDIKEGKGPATSLFINEIERPKPTAAQALIRVKAFGLNRMDLLQREGQYPVPPQAPKTLGVEFSGIIEELASESESGFKKGDAVFGLAYGGAYAEYIVVSTHMLVHKPDELSFEECAGIPETWITALQAMYMVADYKPNQSILWHAGASNVSIAGIQLSKADSASKIFATTRSDEKNKFVVEKLGATAAFNSETQDWAEEVLKATDGKGVDIIVDFMGAGFFAGNLKAAARDAHIVTLAALTGMKLPAETDMGAFLFKRVRLEGSTLRARDEKYQGKLRDQLVEHALPKFKDGTFKAYVEKVMDWEKIVEAHQLMESNKTKGKIIMTIDW
ncbi:putative quinone oxidoreductase [Aureobasidium pullulans]|uniref:Putative quinone oxidoreductase n=2 Tax=Aureobasidium pullulans TaxID=5580 RepID=A0A4T0B4I2_AURPU|nr:putative quinone oxidoreductase [Aureobasidium pullulans]THX05606.1 putative quinone oxidoreductase [Aureobasidium pullulans]THZ30338.1 putative quinone oxidoreductase [Aureobasidium pullulans]THZ84274.1 putative quinone oxidoreductase [Aureobasidium pullulans]TIA02231.1 putative quinone oxidoreductase [Aureobasidium pullulans]